MVSTKKRSALVKSTAKAGRPLCLSGVAAVVILVGADAPTRTTIPEWAWWIAWGAVLAGGLLWAGIPMWHALLVRRERHLQEAEAARLARVIHFPPDPRDVTYNEGCWWTILDRGSEELVMFQCQVFDPLGRDPVRSFAEAGSSPVVCRYPIDFPGIARPLPSGPHTVVWTCVTPDSREERVRVTFAVGDDAAACATVRHDLAERWEKGQALANELPADDFADWERRARLWVDELQELLLRLATPGSSGSKQSSALPRGKPHLVRRRSRGSDSPPPRENR